MSLDAYLGLTLGCFFQSVTNSQSFKVELGSKQRTCMQNEEIANEKIYFLGNCNYI